MIVTLFILGYMPDSWGAIKGFVAIALICEFAVFISILADLALTMTMKDLKRKWRD